MTVKELYELAVKNGVENLAIIVYDGIDDKGYVKNVVKGRSERDGTSALFLDADNSCTGFKCNYYENILK